MTPRTMLAARVHRFGGPEVIGIERTATPAPSAGEVLVQVSAAGVGPWDALIRAGRSGVAQSLPLTPGADICGRIVGVGPAVQSFEQGEAVYGATNPSFVGGYAQYALAKASMIAPKPPTLSDVEAASAPVIGVTALQLLWDHAKLQPGQSVLIHGATGNVGGYAVAIAKAKGVHVMATARPQDRAALRALELEGTVDLDGSEGPADAADAAIDLVGGRSQDQLMRFVRPGGIVVSTVSLPNPDLARARGVRTDFFIVAVDSRRLTELTELFRAGVVRPNVGKVLPLSSARAAHELMASQSRPGGKIVLAISETAGFA